MKKGYLFHTLLCIPIFTTGCELFHKSQQTVVYKSGFHVESVRIQPAFTKILEADPEKKLPARIEVYLQFRDQFQDSMKAPALCRFEMYHHRPAFSDPRGKRFDKNGVQEISLLDLQINQEHWDSISRCYRLTLDLPEISSSMKQIVLQATCTFEPDFRLQDMIVLQRK